jgi:hypothetical protein
MVFGGDAVRTSIVVCTFNRIEWLPQCLASLIIQNPLPDEIIVVDGPSVDGTRELLEEMERDGVLKLIRQKQLDGISAARNLGLAAATGDIVCFIDDDALAQPGWLKAVLDGYVDEKVGGVGGPVHHMDGRLCMGRNAVSTEGLWFDESRNEQTDGCYPVMVGCNMSFRRRPLVDAGGFDPYFMYHQDETDACLGVLRLGYRIQYQEGAVVWHEWCEGSYRKDMLRWYIRLRYLWGRNNSYLVRKHFGTSVPFFRYCGNRAAAFINRRRVATESPGEKMRTDPRLPPFLSYVGVLSEACGLLQGWRDARLHRLDGSRPPEPVQRLA